MTFVLYIIMGLFLTIDSLLNNDCSNFLATPHLLYMFLYKKLVGLVDNITVARTTLVTNLKDVESLRTFT